MVTHTINPEAAANYPEPISREDDSSAKAPGEGPQEPVDWEAKAKAADAKAAKATADLSSMNGRYQALRRDVENGALSHQADSFAPALAKGMEALAQAIDPEGTTGVASQIKGLMAEGTAAASESALVRKEAGYIEQMNTLIADYGLDKSSPEIAGAMKLFNDSKTTLEMEQAAGMIKDAALRKGSPVGAPTSLMPKEGEPNPASDGPGGPGAPAPTEGTEFKDMNPGAQGSSVASASGQSLLDVDISKLSHDDLPAHKKLLEAARKRGDYFPKNAFG